MTETERRIKAYQKLLPELRERVMAVALLLAMSASMLSSASFAWLTLSRSPEVTAVSTNIAANGSLEVALASGNGKVAPGESQVGDSNSAEGQSITGANVTWGNLINLSDESYGLEHMVLRPAQLNRTNLLGSPLYGAAYSSDGRITKLETDFGYTAWVVDETVGGRFETTDQLGVRAISSMKMDTSSSAGKVQAMLSEVYAANAQAAATYQSLANNEAYMQSLATMMGLFMTARMNSTDEELSNPDCNVSDLENLRDLYAGFLAAFEQEVDAIVQLANITLYLRHQGEENSYQPVTRDRILSTSTTSTTLKSEGIQITDLTQFQQDRTVIAEDLEKLKTLCDESGSTVKWSDSGLEAIVNRLVDVGACTIGEDNTPISSIGVSNALGYLSGTQEAKITNGILYRFEERTGGYLEVKDLSISATVKRSGFTVPATVKANIRTTASRDYYLFNNDYKETRELLGAGNLAADSVAQDTYGLAIDVWVRTNAENSYLTLEGNVVTRTDTIRATGKNADNETVDLYTLKRTVTDEESGESQTISNDVYMVDVTDEDTNTDDIYTVNVTNTETNEVTQKEGYLYYLANHTRVTREDGDEVNAKMEEIVTVIGYEGENRIWDKDTYSTMLSTDSTTQGSGSCYVYYADTPEDQARSLKLLEAFKVAFVDSRGKMLASAYMDTQNAYAAVGRVTVPLVLDPSESVAMAPDSQGNVEYAITLLERNEPMLITAIVYLDGTKLTNQDVLAAADIQGQLNIQFGSTTSMVAVESEELMNQSVSISATVTPTEFKWDETDDPLTAEVTITVSGYEPKSMSGFFVRQVSSTQGSREDPMTFSKQPDGTWKATYTFTSPGNYVLRTIRMDGVDYDVGQEVTVLDEYGNPILDENGNEQTKVEYPGSTVEGFTISTLECTQANESRTINVMSAASEYTVNMNISFASNDEAKMPKTVQARFLDESGTNVNVDFTYNPTQKIWSGKGTFRVSGDYTLRHVVLDGEVMPLEEKFWMDATISLGMRAAVYTEDNVRFQYLPGSLLEDGKTTWDSVYGKLDMQVMITDGSGKEKPGLRDVGLTYVSGSRAVYTPLTWNGSYYVGQMDNGGPGIWKFSNVTIGESNTITQATRSPTFTIISPNPPEYLGHDTSSYQFALGSNRDVTMNVKLGYASTADNVVATIVNQKTGVATQVESKSRSSAGDAENQPYYFAFVVPYNSGYQDGNWQLTEVKLWGGVYGKDEYGNTFEYTAENPCVFNVADTNNVTKIVNKVTATFLTDGEGDTNTFNLGGTSLENATATFLSTQTIAAGELSVTIEDFDGKPVYHEYEANGVTNKLGVDTVSLEFAYVNGTSQYHGGYTSDSLTNATEGAKITVPLTQVMDDEGKLTTKYTNANAVSFLYAGDYTTIFTYTVKTSTGGESVTYPDADNNRAALANTPTVHVWSKRPTVTVTGVSPTGSIEAYTATRASDGETEWGHRVSGAFNHVIDDYSAVVYIYSGSTLPYNVYTPTVTLKISDMPSTFTASMTFPNQYDSSYNAVYEFTANNQEKTAHIGGGTNGGLFDNVHIYPAGKQTVSQITATVNGVPYTVDLSNDVTINQPQYPPYAIYTDISSVDSTYTGSTPANVYSTDGETVTIKLPDATTGNVTMSWTKDHSSSVDGTFAAVGTPTTRTVHTKTFSYTVIVKTYYNYVKYTETKTTYQAVSSLTTWTNTHTITGWKIGDKTYAPGETVTVTGNATIIPVISVSEGAKTTTSKTATYYAYTYTQTASASNKTSVPSGYGTEVDSATNYNTDVTYS